MSAAGCCSPRAPRAYTPRRALVVLVAFSGVALSGKASRAGRRRLAIAWLPPQGEVHQASLAVRTLGAGDHAFLLVHGLAGSNLYWGAQYEELADHALLVVPDLLGFASSPRPDSDDYGPDAHADALAATLHQVGVERPAVVVAHSTGCLVALRLAARHPALVAGILGFGPPLYRDRHQAKAHLSGLGVLTRLFALDTPLAHRLCAWLCCQRPGLAARLAQLSRPDLPAPVARDGVRHSWASYTGTLRRVVLDAPAMRWLEAVKVPVHLVAGESDGVVDLGFLGELAARYPLLSVEAWTRSGHDAPLTDPARCLEAIRAFSSRLDQPVGGCARAAGRAHEHSAERGLC